MYWYGNQRLKAHPESLHCACLMATLLDLARTGIVMGLLRGSLAFKFCVYLRANASIRWCSGPLTVIQLVLSHACSWTGRKDEQSGSTLSREPCSGHEGDLEKSCVGSRNAIVSRSVCKKVRERELA